MHLFRPHVMAYAAARKLIRSTARQLGDTEPEDVEVVRDRALEQVDKIAIEEDAARLHLRIALSVLCDLRAHDWEVVAGDQDVHVARPDRSAMNPRAHKDHVREGLLIERDSQLMEPATRRFVMEMERRRLHGKEFVSVYSLMRDGAELAGNLRRARELPEGVARSQALKRMIDPYIQVVEAGVPCEHTGLDLQDIWRYFRHTWVTPYRSVPGRQLSFLVRDRAVRHHPVIGIGALASSVVQQKRRDRWIGWHPLAFLESLEADQYRGWSRWLSDRLDDLLSELYVRDFVKEGILARKDIRNPSIELISRLRRLARKERTSHRLYRQGPQHKQVSTKPGVDWREQAETYLFRSKRADRLATLLRARLDLVESGFTKTSPERLRAAAASPRGRQAIKTVLRFVKAAHVGIDMMDISVCGAVEPYRSILGGKLVALLLASPAVVKAYSKRYHDATSIIASSMAGKSLNRTPRLVLLMTTSLYSVAAAQYNRLKVRPEQHGGAGTLEYKDLEQTIGWGSYHFSKTTMDAMEVLLAQADRGREVNSIFGEGVNPKLRKVRMALVAVGLPADHLMRHGSQRIVYAVPLASNFRDVLIGRARRPQYVLPQVDGTARLVAFWHERWLGPRILRDDVLDRVSNNNLSYPIDHGARVRLPSLPSEQIETLFE